MAPVDDPTRPGEGANFEGVSTDVTVDDDGGAVIRVAGEIDIATADIVRTAVADAIGHSPARLVFDMEAVDFMDSSGIAVLLEAAQLVDSVQVRRPSKVVRRVIETTGLSDVLPIGE